MGAGMHELGRAVILSGVFEWPSSKAWDIESENTLFGCISLEGG